MKKLAPSRMTKFWLGTLALGVLVVLVFLARGEDIFTALTVAVGLFLGGVFLANTHYARRWWLYLRDYLGKDRR